MGRNTICTLCSAQNVLANTCVCATSLRTRYLLFNVYMCVVLFRCVRLGVQYHAVEFVRRHVSICIYVSTYIYTYIYIYIHVYAMCETTCAISCSRIHKTSLCVWRYAKRKWKLRWDTTRCIFVSYLAGIASIESVLSGIRPWD